MVTPCFSARGSSVSAASSAMRDRSTCSRVKDRWSARLSSSSASVRSIARALTARRRSTSSPLSRSGSLRATSSRVCVIASGVRSSWEALAANRCCSATCASSRASMVSKASASSRNSSLRPGSRIRWDERPVRGQAGGVGDAGQRGEHAAGQDPSAQRGRTPAGTPARRLPLRREGALAGRSGLGANAPPMPASRGSDDRSVGEVAQQEHPHDGEQQGTREHEEPGVAEGEFEANAQTRRPIHGPLPRARCRSLCRCGSRRRARWR